MISREWTSLPIDVRDTIEAFQMEAPVKISAIARALGVPVLASSLSLGISGEVRPVPGANGSFVIRINRHDPQRRQRFTAAHELAHVLLHKDELGDGLGETVLFRSSNSDRREVEANRLAADILMPSDLVHEHAEAAKVAHLDDIVAYVADKLDVSEVAMRIRMEQLGIRVDATY